MECLHIDTLIVTSNKYLCFYLINLSYFSLFGHILFHDLKRDNKFVFFVTFSSFLNFFWHNKNQFVYLDWKIIICMNMMII